MPRCGSWAICRLLAAPSEPRVSVLTSLRWGFLLPSGPKERPEWPRTETLAANQKTRSRLRHHKPPRSPTTQRGLFIRRVKITGNCPRSVPNKSMSRKAHLYLQKDRFEGPNPLAAGRAEFLQTVRQRAVGHFPFGHAQSRAQRDRPALENQALRAHERGSSRFPKRAWPAVHGGGK